MAGLRMLFTTDLHGSESAFRKFVNAAIRFDIDTLLLGGDLTGKTLAPIVGRDGAYVAELMGRRVEVDGELGLAELEETFRLAGQYPFRCSEEELERLKADEAEVDRRFEDAIRVSLRRWFDLAEERLRGRGCRVLAIAGNDDPWSIDAELREHAFVECVDGEVIALDDGTEILGFGGSNRTPWRSPREYDEEDIAARVRPLVERLQSPELSIWNVHVPPYECGLDTVAKVDEDLNLVLEGGQTVPVSAGSHAVRRLIDEVQPAVTAHGHVHESRGVARLGATTVVNPGSEYTEGILRAAFITRHKSKVRVQLMSA